MKIITNSLEETKQKGTDLAKKSKPGDVLLLYGDLGSGKTSFLQGFAKGLGINKRILSPTFVLIRSYKSKDLNFNHVDLYRLEEKSEIENLGIEEIINDANSITAIEWADRIKEFFPKKGYRLFFDYLGENKRSLIIKELNGSR